MIVLDRKFKVGINDLLFSPFFLIRYYLYQSISENAGLLNGKMLDFGCGTKPYKHLFNHVSDYIGVDFEGGGNVYEKKDVEFFYNGHQLPFDDHTFDSALATEVFEHIFNIDEILGEINRVLKPGGRLLLTCPFLWPEHEQPWDYARYSSFGIKALLEKHGFRVIKQGKTGNYIVGIYQLFVLFIYYLIPKVPVLYHIAFLTITLPFSIVTGLLAIILPKKLLRKDLYLNNVLVVEKG